MMTDFAFRTLMSFICSIPPMNAAIGIQTSRVSTSSIKKAYQMLSIPRREQKYSAVKYSRRLRRKVIT